MPRGYTFLQTLDMFIKVHAVFNLAYSVEINKVMHFIQYINFDMFGSKVFMTNRMTEIAGRMVEPAVTGA